MILRQYISAVTLLCFGALLNGCGRSPQVSFYTLGTSAKVTAPHTSKSGPSVYVAAVTLPAVVDRPQLVENVSVNRLEILESHRWAEPLRGGISRLLVENLASQLGTDMVAAYPQISNGEPDYRVAVDIQRFESLGDSVSVDAFWSIRRAAVSPSDSGKPDKVPFIRTGRSQPRESRGGQGYEALVAAYNRALVSVGSDIAQAIRADWEGAR